MQANDVNLDIADPKWQDGCAWGLAMGAITGGVNNIVTKPPDIAIGRGGLYLTTLGVTVKDGKEEVSTISLNMDTAYDAAIGKVKDLFAKIGLVDIHVQDGYVCGSISGGYGLRYGPLLPTTSGTLATDGTLTGDQWSLSFTFNGKIIKTYTYTVKWSSGCYFFSASKVTLDVGAGYTQNIVFFYLGDTKFYVYVINKTNYLFLHNAIYVNGAVVQATCKTKGYVDAFLTGYSKFFCDPSTYTDIEQQITGWYPVYINGKTDKNLVIAPLRYYISNDAWYIAKEAGGHMGYIMSTHIICENGTPTFLVLDHGEQYADYVDKYLVAQNVTPYMVTERSEI